MNKSLGDCLAVPMPVFETKHVGYEVISSILDGEENRTMRDCPSAPPIVSE